MPPIPELRVAAARYVLGDLPSWEMPQFADRLAELDICSTAISDLATMREPIMSDAGPLFEQILRESAIDLPSVDESLEIVLRLYVSQIASRVIGPRPGLRSIANIYYSANLYDRSRHDVGDSHGLEHLLASFYLYDDTEECSLEDKNGPEAHRALDEDVVRQANDWLEAHGRE
jgi:hypothetical protein